MKCLGKSGTYTQDLSELRCETFSRTPDENEIVNIIYSPCRELFINLCCVLIISCLGIDSLKVEPSKYFRNISKVKKLSKQMYLKYIFVPKSFSGQDIIS